MLGRKRDSVFVLIHSPLVGPTTWLPVARELELRGRTAVVPSLLEIADAEPPQWRRAPQVVRAAATRIEDAVVLVGHSGGGVLLPVIAEALSAEVAALVFVDSFLPPACGSLPLGRSQFIDQLQALATDGVLPRWSDWFGQDAMRDLVPDDHLRTALEDEMPQMPVSYFEASVPLPDGWEKRPCGYLMLTAETYAQSATDARGRGWAVAEIPGVQHLAIVTEPIAVTDALLNLEHAVVKSA